MFCITSKTEMILLLLLELLLYFRLFFLRLMQAWKMTWLPPAPLIMQLSRCSLGKFNLQHKYQCMKSPAACCCPCSSYASTQGWQLMPWDCKEPAEQNIIYFKLVMPVWTSGLPEMKGRTPFRFRQISRRSQFLTAMENPLPLPFSNLLFLSLFFFFFPVACVFVSPQLTKALLVHKAAANCPHVMLVWEGCGGIFKQYSRPLVSLADLS